MLSKFKSAKHQQHLAQLPKLAQSADDVETLFHTRDFKGRLLAEIAGAKKTVYISALYIEHDDAGRDFLDALYAAKKPIRNWISKSLLTGTAHSAGVSVQKRMPPMPTGITPSRHLTLTCLSLSSVCR